MTQLPSRRRLTRLAGVALAAYGTLGLVLAIGVLIVGGGVAQQAESAGDTLDASVDAAASSLANAATAFSGFDASLEEAQQSAGQAAELARDTSATMRQLAATMSLRIFGAQPLLPLAADFERAASQLTALGDSMERIGDNLGANREEVSQVSRDLEVLASQIEVLQAATSEPPPLRALLYLLVAWLVLPSLGALVVGAWLLGIVRAAPR